MSLFRGALFLFQIELKRSITSVVITLGLIAFTLLMCTSTYINILDAYHPTLSNSMHFLSDYMFILTFGAIGVIVTFLYGGGFKRDILADRVAYYRSLPISSEQIVLSKILASLISAFVGMLIFFIGNLVGFSIFSDFRISELSYAYIVHAIFLYGLMIAVNNLFVWFDLSINYKAYTICNAVFVILVMKGALALSIESDNQMSFLYWAYLYSEENPIQGIVIGLALVIVTSFISYKVTTASLKRRNLG